MIALYPYNQRDYEAMCAMLEERGRAGVIKPCGEGKAMLGMHLAEEHPDKLVLWVNPKILHIQSQKNNARIQSAKGPGPSHDFSNVVTMTYDAVLAAAKKGVKPVLDKANPDREPDYIILDEFHHAGGPEWGKGVAALLAAFPNAKLAGFTATPVRPTDGRDMAEELYGEDIAVYVTVIDSWKDPSRPLEPPTYVRTFYDKDEELKRIASLRKRVESLPESNSGRREQVQAKIAKMTRTIEDADGVDEVIVKHITESDARVLVFCSNKKHLDELSSPEKVQEWFAGVNRDVHVYCVEHSKKQDNAAELENFTNDTSDALKVLYSIDMLSESLHVKGCRYAIMARPTESPNIWLQQMGRVFEKDNQGRNGLIIDLVGNYSRANKYNTQTAKKTKITAKTAAQVTQQQYMAEIREAIGVSRITDQVADNYELEEDVIANLNYIWVDHTGQDFPTVKAMCEAWGILVSTYNSRIAHKWTLEEALTGNKEKVGGTPKPCTDHVGNKFPSIAAMCEHWGADSYICRSRINSGWSIEKALTTPDNLRACVDHLGNEFHSKAAMCKHYNIDRTTYNGRIANGWSVEEALTGNREGKCGPKPYTDHKGNEFPSIAEMCRAWDVGYDTYTRRVRNGYTLEEALTGKREGKCGSKPCTDHEGNEYPSVNAMCKAWTVDYSVFKCRRRRGWTLEKALTTPIKKR